MTQQKWTEMKTEYLANRDLTIVAVARKYKLTEKYVWDVARKEGWKAQKEKQWKDATDAALEEVSGGIKDLVTRHAKMARYAQSGAMLGLKTIIEFFQKNPNLLTPDGNIDPSIMNALTSLFGEGLKAERELYPKQMQITEDIRMLVEEIPNEMVEPFYEGFKAALTAGKATAITGKQSRHSRKPKKAAK